MIAVHVLFSSEAADARINIHMHARTQGDRDKPYGDDESAARIALRSLSQSVSASEILTVSVSKLCKRHSHGHYIYTNCCIKSTVNDVLTRVQ